MSFFTEGVGAGPRKHMDILGLSMNDGADLRVHPSGKAIVSISAQTQGQGHETTFAQIVAEELGIPPEDVEVRHGDTDKSPDGLGTYGSRSTPVSGGAVAIVSRKVRDRARLMAATMLETRPEDLAWEKGRWYVKGDPEKGAMIEEIAERAYSGEPMPEGMEGGLDAQTIYDPPNLTYPYGAYIAVVDIDPDTAQVTVRHFIAVDDCGVRINPMVVDGQIHGGLAEGVGIAPTSSSRSRRDAGRTPRDAATTWFGRGPEPRPHAARIGGDPRSDHRGVGARTGSSRPQGVGGGHLRRLHGGRRGGARTLAERAVPRKLPAARPARGGDHRCLE